MSEIDRLEIQIEAEASKANRQLNSMVNKLNKVAAAMSKIDPGSIGKVGQNLSKSLNLDTSGLARAEKSVKRVSGSLKGLKKKKINVDADTSSLEKAKKDVKSFDDLLERFKDAGKNVDFSGMNLSELQKQEKLMDKSLGRLWDRFDKKSATEGFSDNKGFQSLAYDIDSVSNKLEILRSRIAEVKAAAMSKIDDVFEVPEITDGTDADWVRGNSSNMKSYDSKTISDQVKSGRITPDIESVDANYKAIDDLMAKYRNVGQGVDFSGMDFADIQKQAASLENTIDKLWTKMDRKIALNGFDSGRRDIKSLAYDISYATNQLEEYRAKMAEMGQSSLSMETVSGKLKQVASVLGGISGNAKKLGNTLAASFKKARSAISGFLNSAKKISSVVISPIAALGRLKNAATGARNEFRKPFTIPKMVGMSVLYSSVFGMISGIKQALADGSNNLVQYSNAYNQSISGIVSSLLYLKNAWAAAFAPIINVVGPYLQAFVDMVASALNAVGKFFAALTGKGFTVQAVKVMQDYGASLSDTASSAGSADKAAKKLKRTLMGFDQINRLDDPDSDSGSGSGGGGGGGAGGVSPSEMFKTEKVDGALADFAKKLREAFLKEDWEGLGKILADGVNKGLQKLYDVINWSNVGPKISKFCNAFTRVMNSLVDHINWDLMGRTVGAGINTIVNTLNLLLTGFNFANLGLKFAIAINGIFTEVDWGNLGALLGNKIMAIWNTLFGLVVGLDYAKIGKSFAEGVNGIFGAVNFTTIALTLSTALNGIAEMIQNFVQNVNWDSMARNLYNGINKFITRTNWTALGTQLSNFVMALLGTINTVVQNTDWQALGRSIGNFLGSIDWVGIISTVGDIIFTAFTGVISGLFSTGSGKVFLALVGGLTLLNGAFKVVNIAASIGEWVTGIGEAFGVLGPLFTGKIIPLVSSGITGLVSMFGTIASAAGSLITKVVPILLKLINPWTLIVAAVVAAVVLIVKNWDSIKAAAGQLFDKLKEVWGKIQTITTNVFSAIRNFVTSTWRNIKTAITDPIGKAKSTVESAVSKIKSVATNTFSTLKSSVETVWRNIKNAITEPIGKARDFVKKAIDKIKGFFDFKWSLPKLKLPHISITGKFSLKPPSAPSFGIEWYAKGGFPNMGEMFVANEKGPEMVGKMGRRNVVANNMQITSSIREAVVDGMMEAAMTTAKSSGDGQIVVENTFMVDSETLYRMTQKGAKKADRRYKVVAPI